MASVTLHTIDKFYGDVHVVRGLDLEVSDGEFVVLVGPSGCGKSTTLRMIAGLETISGGELSIGDRVVNDLTPRQRDIAMVFQSYALYPHMTVYENMAFGLRIRKMPRAEIDNKVRTAAQLLGLSELLERRPKALSGGQRQRVAMGRAVVRDPSVFLFDEPLSNLDAKLRVQMRLEVARLHKRLDATIIYVTHDQVEAMTLADRIAVMHNGILQQCATPDDIYERPANTFVSTFIGSPAMNLLPVRATVDGEMVRAEGPGVSWRSDGHLAKIWREHMPEKEGFFTLGVRPQDLELVTDGGTPDLRLQVDVVEPLGSETFIYGTQLNEDNKGTALPTEPLDPSTRERLESPIIVRLDPGHRAKTGDKLAFRITPGHAHIFLSDGERIQTEASIQTENASET